MNQINQKDQITVPVLTHRPFPNLYIGYVLWIPTIAMIETESLKKVKNLIGDGSNRYKFSDYNIIVNIDDGSFLIFNTKTGAFSIFPSHFEKNKENEITLNNLLNAGYVIEKERDEVSELINNFKKIRQDKTIMRLIILAAEICNFRCAYCYETFRSKMISDKIAQGIINFIKRNIGNIRILEISWFGGELLLAASLIINITRMCQDIAKKFGVKFLSDITTNGYLLSPSLLEKLIKVGITGYQLTIDGTPNVHNRFRKLKNGGETFQKIWVNLQAIKRVDADIYVTVRTNFDENSIEELKDWIDLYCAEFSKDQRFRLVFRPIFGSDTKRDLQIKICPLRKAAAIENELFLLLWEKLGFPFAYFSEVILPRPKAVYCYGGLPGCFVVGADGSVWKCTVALKEEDAIGHLREDGEIVMNNQKLNDWDKYVESWIFDVECQKCLSLPLCMGGCILSRKGGGKGCYSSPSSIAETMKVYYYKKWRKGGD